MPSRLDHLLLMFFLIFFSVHHFSFCFGTADTNDTCTPKAKSHVLLLAPTEL